MALDRGQPGGASFAGCFTRKEESWSKRGGLESLPRPLREGGRGRFTSREERGVGWSAVGENDSEKLGSMRKESVKLAGTF